MADNTWMDEFNLHDIPHANTYIHVIKKERELKKVNICFNKEYGDQVPSKSYKVTFSDEITTTYYTEED